MSKICEILIPRICRTALLTMCCAIFPFLLEAQVFPPDFSCIRNDTLFWQLPMNDCGSFNAHLIYTSDNIDGPYSLLATITDPLENSFAHPNPSGATIYYYMEGDYNCPGEIVLQSDTLDNNSPLPNPVGSVSVDGNNVIVNWEENPSPEVTSYIIYRVTPSGTIPLDTVFNQTTYTDLGAQPTISPEIYYVVARDDCDNTSIFDLPHFTTHLISGASICDRSVELAWNPYQNWQNEIEEQQIWLSINGAPHTQVGTVGATDTVYVFEDANDGDYYCFYIEMIESNTGVSARSNEVCLDVDIVEPIRELQIINVTLNEFDDVELEWVWNTDAELLDYDIVIYQPENDAVPVINFPVSGGLDYFNLFIDSLSITSEGAISYEIVIHDACNDEITTELVSTIFAEGIAQENRTNLIRWMPFELTNAVVKSYEVFHADGFTNPSLGIFNTDEFSYVNTVDPRIPSEAIKCYYVIATADVTLPDGTIQEIKSRSNTVCVKQFSTIFSPNAFVPYGKNNVFKPVVLFPEAVNEYQLLVYDRWGQILFESNEIEIGWDGQKDGRDIPAGIYPYLIRLVQPNGEVLEDKGMVTLIR